MTWGVQNTEADAHTQLSYAINDSGVNFIDTAEIYPVPPRYLYGSFLVIAHCMCLSGNEERDMCSAVPKHRERQTSTSLPG